MTTVDAPPTDTAAVTDEGLIDLSQLPIGALLWIGRGRRIDGLNSTGFLAAHRIDVVDDHIEVCTTTYGVREGARPLLASELTDRFFAIVNGMEHPGCISLKDTTIHQAAAWEWERPLWDAETAPQLARLNGVTIWKDGAKVSNVDLGELPVGSLVSFTAPSGHYVLQRRRHGWMMTSDDPMTSGPLSYMFKELPADAFRCGLIERTRPINSIQELEHEAKPGHLIDGWGLCIRRPDIGCAPPISELTVNGVRLS